MMTKLRAVALAAALAMGAPGIANATTVLVMDSDRVLNESAVGQDIRAKLQSIAQTMDSELKAEGSPVQEEWEKFQAEVEPLTRESLRERTDLQQRGTELRQQIGQLAQSEQIKARELVATRAQALRPVREKLDEVLQALVEELNADILVERDVLIYAQDESDITELVIERLNTAISTVEVERVTLPAAAQEAAAQ